MRKTTASLCSTIALLMSASALAFIFDEEDEEIEEIVVFGSPWQGFADGGIGNWLSWEISVPFSAPILYSRLMDAQDAVDEANEQACATKIEEWRSDCKAAYMQLGGVSCTIVGGMYFGGFVRSILPAAFNAAGAPGVAASANGVGCARITERAVQWCDRMADSPRASEIAQCD